MILLICIPFKLLRIDLHPQDIHRQIQQHRAATPFHCNGISFFQIETNFIGRFYISTILCQRGYNRYDIRFLKPSLPDAHASLALICIDISCQHNYGYGVIIGMSDTGDQIRCPRTSCRISDAGFHGYFSICRGCKCRSLLMVYHMGMNLFPFVKRVNKIGDRSARISKDICDPLFYDKIYDIICYLHLAPRFLQHILSPFLSTVAIQTEYGHFVLISFTISST